MNKAPDYWDKIITVFACAGILFLGFVLFYMAVSTSGPWFDWNIPGR